MSAVATGTVDAVCVVHAEIPGVGRHVPTTAIDKRPVDSAVRVEAMGITTDHVCDTIHHGGLHQAVYAYAEEESARWSDELGKPTPAGWYGENLRVSGLLVTDAVIGQQWLVGSVLLEVTAPRVPCATFQMFAEEQQWVRRFTERGDVGAYLRVIETGEIAAGDAIEILSTPAHGITVRDLFVGQNPDRLERLLAEEPTLSPNARDRAEWHLKRVRTA